MNQPLNINILPEQYRPRRIEGSMTAIILALAVLLFGLMPAYAVLATARSRTAALEARLDEARAILARFAVDQEQLTQMEEQIEALRTQIEQLDADLGAIGPPRAHRADGIRAAALARAGALHITSITQDGDVFILSGEADDEALVLNYARALQSTGQFANVRILSIVNDSSVLSVQFSIRMEQ